MTNVSVSELVGTTRDVTIGGKTIKIRQFKIKELFAHFENVAIQKKIDGAKKVSEALDDDHKISFMLKVWDELPQGEALTELATKSMFTVDGIIDLLYLAAKDFNKDLDADDIKNLVEYKDINSLTSIISWATGFEKVDLGVEAGEAEASEEDKKK